MKVTVVYRDNEPPTAYENVGKVTVIAIGVGTYVILNESGVMIAHVPCDVVRRIECPEHDSKVLMP